MSQLLEIIVFQLDSVWDLPVDWGLPLDCALPPDDGGLPLLDGGLPVVDVGLPVVDVGLPVVDVGLLVLDDGLSVVDETLPFVDGGLPFIISGLLARGGFSLDGRLLSKSTSSPSPWSTSNLDHLVTSFLNSAISWTFCLSSVTSSLGYLLGSSLPSITWSMLASGRNAALGESHLKLLQGLRLRSNSPNVRLPARNIW